MAQTFPKQTRLRAQSEFRRVQSRGNRLSRGTLLLLVDRSLLGIDAKPRLGMVVSRKVGTAVKRNAIKRWIREWFRTHFAELPRGVDLVVIAKRGAAERGHQAVLADILSLMSRIGSARPADRSALA